MGGLFTSVIPSVAESCAWAFGSVLFLVLGFTRSLRIGLFVFMTILCIVVCLVAFMCLVMKWTFGLTEALSVTIFVGFSVDYALHLAQAYRNAPFQDRHLKLRQGMLEVGSPLIAAAATTTGSAIFLLGCTYIPLFKMGLFTSVIPSVAESCAWAFGSVLFLVLGFTRSLRIGLFVFMTILCIVVCLVAFMCLVMKWTFGLTEALSVT